MTVIDVDSHYYEPFDWLEQTDPGMAEQLPEVDRLTLVASTAFGEVLSTLPPQYRPDIYRNFPGVRGADGSISSEGLSRAEQIVVTAIEAVPGAHCAADRLRFMDERGIDKQFVLPTFAFNPISWVRREKMELTPRILDAYNRWSVGNVAGHTERLIPVIIVDHKTMDRPSIELALRNGREAGARSVLFWPSPVEGKALSHPDYEWFWAACAELGLMPMIHVGAGRPNIDLGWLNNGRDFPSSLVAYFSQLHQIPELVLSELIASGTFERHPDLRVLICELGVDWLPSFVRRLDGLAKQAKAFRSAWPYPKLPSEYISQNVRVSPLSGDPAASVIERVGKGILVFSTDYPHPEGNGDAVRSYREKLQGKVGEDAIAEFFGRTIEADLALGA